jgi:hypothetical protein
MEFSRSTTTVANMRLYNIITLSRGGHCHTRSAVQSYNAIHICYIAILKYYVWKRYLYTLYLYFVRVIRSENRNRRRSVVCIMYTLSCVQRYKLLSLLLSSWLLLFVIIINIIMLSARPSQFIVRLPPLPDTRWNVSSIQF